MGKWKSHAFELYTEQALGTTNQNVRALVHKWEDNCACLPAVGDWWALLDSGGWWEHTHTRTHTRNQMIILNFWMPTHGSYYEFHSVTTCVCVHVCGLLFLLRLGPGSITWMPFGPFGLSQEVIELPINLRLSMLGLDGYMFFEE